MTDRKRRILVVARNTQMAARLAAWLEDCGCETIVAGTFAMAKRHLEARPDLLVSEVKLGEYNGLHLALKAAAAHVPSVLIGPDDAVLRKDAESLRASYLISPTRTALLEAVVAMFPPREEAHTPAARPFRARVTTVASEAEVIWRAFSESPSSEVMAFGRTMLPS